MKQSALRVPRGLTIAAVLAAIVVLVLVVFVLATLPSRSLPVRGVDAALASRTVAGAFHVHTTRSDGLADKASVAGAARRAGLQFVVFTDHGDGTRTPDPPQYIDGVLCIDGVEISTDGGHYIAVGAAPSPYPLGGEPFAVWEDVRRLGGFGIAAHPTSSRQELAWSDWSLPFEAVEWLNADTEWRDESRWRLARAVAAYPLRPAGSLASLLDRPVSALARWDALGAARMVFAIAGHDAHGGIGRRIEDASPRRSLRIPAYEATFRTFSTRAVLDRPLTGDAAPDGRSLLDALRGGKFYTEVGAIASASTLEFTARADGAAAEQGSLLAGSGLASFTARAAVPAGATTIAFRNGVEVARSRGGRLAFESADRGAYRVEVHVDGAPGEPPVPWIVSNPIFRLFPRPLPPIAARSIVVPLAHGDWRIEKDPGSQGAVRVDKKSGEVVLEYRLRPGSHASQFVALATDLPRDLPDFDSVSFVAQASAPQRVSVQLRFAADGHGRWRKSAYVDRGPMPVTVAVRDFQRADGPAERPGPARATSLLFVVDLTNARPGDGGAVTLTGVGLAR